jgi:hypothetical protein
MTTTELAPPAEEAAVATTAAPPPPSGPPTRPRMRRPIKIAFVVILVVSVLEAFAFTSTYLLYSRH